MSLPLPQATWESEPFWSGGEHGELLITRCGSCGLWLHPPVPVCRRCRSTDVTPTPASGRARVVTWSINRVPWDPSLEVPYVIAIVELEESTADEPLRLTTRLVDVPPEEVRESLAVRVVFEQATDETGSVWLPLFEVAR